MDLASINLPVTDEAGNILPGATVEVRREIAGLPLATLFSDRDGASPADNPTTSDWSGHVLVFAPGGAYQITVTKGAYQRTLRYIAVGTAAEHDVADLVLIAGGQTVGGGYRGISYDGGTITGADQTFTPDAFHSNKQHITLDGAALTGTFTFGVPEGKTNVEVEVTNGGTGDVAASLSTAGFTKVDGAWSATNGKQYLFYAQVLQHTSILYISEIA